MTRHPRSWSALVWLLVLGNLPWNAIAEAAPQYADVAPPPPEAQPVTYPPPLEEVPIQTLAADDTLYVLSRDRGLLVFSRGAGDALELRTTIGVQGIPHQLLLDGNRLYAVLHDARPLPSLPPDVHAQPREWPAGNGLLLVLDVTTPAAPRVVDQVPMSVPVTRIGVVHGVVCVQASELVTSWVPSASGPLEYADSLAVTYTSGLQVAFTEDLVVAA